MPATPRVRPSTDLVLWTNRLAHAGYMPILSGWHCVFIRGLFLGFNGGKDKLNMFDDGLAVIHNHESVRTFNCNTSPTRYGFNPKAGKFMAELAPGQYTFQHRLHRGKYWAFGQESNLVKVNRKDEDGKIKQTEVGLFGIDLHKASVNSTSSEGCLTIPVEQWPELYNYLPHDQSFKVTLIEVASLPTYLH